MPSKHKREQKQGEGMGVGRDQPPRPSHMSSVQPPGSYPNSPIEFLRWFHHTGMINQILGYGDQLDFRPSSTS